MSFEWFKQIDPKKACRAASDAVGRDVDLVSLILAMSRVEDRGLDQIKSELARCVAEFEATGQGVYLAERIERLRMFVAVRELANEQEDHQALGMVFEGPPGQPQSNQLAEDATPEQDQFLDQFQKFTGSSGSVQDSPSPPKVFLVTYEHKHGTDTYVYSNNDKAIRGAAALALGNTDNLHPTVKDEIVQLAKNGDYEEILEEWLDNQPGPGKIRIEEVLPDEHSESDDMEILYHTRE